MSATRQSPVESGQLCSIAELLQLRDTVLLVLFTPLLPLGIGGLVFLS
jgi:hypothetical protein